MFVFVFILFDHESDCGLYRMQNEEGKFVDLYIPRKCAATNKVIAPKDHASVQIAIGHVNAEGVYTRENTNVAFSGFIRQRGESNAYLDKIAIDAGLIKKY